MIDGMINKLNSEFTKKGKNSTINCGVEKLNNNAGWSSPVIPQLK